MTAHDYETNVSDAREPSREYVYDIKYYCPVSVSDRRWQTRRYIVLGEFGELYANPYWRDFSKQYA